MSFAKFFSIFTLRTLIVTITLMLSIIFFWTPLPSTRHVRIMPNGFSLAAPGQSRSLSKSLIGSVVKTT